VHDSTDAPLLKTAFPVFNTFSRLAARLSVSVTTLLTPQVCGSDVKFSYPDES
jgi:hypothetical protein